MLRRIAVAAVLLTGVAQAFGPAVSDARTKIDALIKASGADVAVAFRTLDGRDELLIQPDADYHAAEHDEVPVMIELFRQARAGTLRVDAHITRVLYESSQSRR